MKGLRTIVHQVTAQAEVEPNRARKEHEVAQIFCRQPNFPIYFIHCFQIQIRGNHVEQEHLDLDSKDSEHKNLIKVDRLHHIGDWVLLIGEDHDLPILNIQQVNHRLKQQKQVDYKADDEVAGLAPLHEGLSHHLEDVITDFHHYFFGIDLVMR